MPLHKTIFNVRSSRFLHGLTKIGVFTVGFVWCMEAVGGRWKTNVGVGFEFPWVVSWLSLGGLVRTINAQSLQNHESKEKFLPRGIL